MAENEPSGRHDATRPGETPRREPSPPIGRRLIGAMLRERVAVLYVAAILIIVRTAVFLFFEGSFNSD